MALRPIAGTSYTAPKLDFLRHFTVPSSVVKSFLAAKYQKKNPATDSRTPHVWTPTLHVTARNQSCPTTQGDAVRITELRKLLNAADAMFTIELEDIPHLLQLLNDHYKNIRKTVIAHIEDLLVFELMSPTATNFVRGMRLLINATNTVAIKNPKGHKQLMALLATLLEKYSLTIRQNPKFDAETKALDATLLDDWENSIVIY